MTLEWDLLVPEDRTLDNEQHQVFHASVTRLQFSDDAIDLSAVSNSHGSPGGVSQQFAREVPGKQARIADEDLFESIEILE